MTEQEIRKELENTLKNDPNNYSKIIELSKSLSSFDENNIRFSVDAGVINRLGKELVGRHETAVSELVKNAYDADAKEVKLIFEKAWEIGGKLHINDDGVGMTKEQLINGFMRLSSSDKIHNPKSPKYDRTRAGRKGIGRFATQRLGDKLTIVTQTEQTDIAYKVVIDWNDFEIDKDLSSIANKIKTVPKEKEEGTDLIIEDLREGWSDAMIKRVYRYTADLLQPFPLSKERKKNENKRIDPGFHSSYFRENEDDNNKIIDEEEAFLKHSLAKIEGYVLDNGQGCWTLKSDKLNFPETIYNIGLDDKKDDSKFKYLRDIHFSCHYFINEDSLLSKQLKTFIQGVGNEKGGLRLYRNGFRVLPYAEKGNDWLRLDESVRRNYILPAHSNNSFFGFVEITDNTGINYEETSSREGLIENEAFKELTGFVYRSLVGAILKIAELRGRKGKTGQKDWKKEELNTPSKKVDEAIAEIKDFFEETSINKKNANDKSSTKNDSNFNKEKFDEAYKKLIENREEERKEKQELIEEINMLRILAALGLVIGEFVHEVKRFLPGFDTDTRFLKKAVKDYVEAFNRVERIEINLKSFTTYTAYFDKAISRNVLRELEPIDLRDVVNDFGEVVKNDLLRTGIILNEPEYEDFDLITTPMHPSEWASILFNFYTNSKKAIKRRGEKGQLFIKCGREQKYVFLEFSDNGDGVSQLNEELIFNPFFTTASAKNLSDSDDKIITGTGLGLKIVRDIIESYGGTVYVSIPEKDFNTTIRIEIPNNENIEENE